jgi:4-amino-4-deoxy-L-arabinose transferase-like glycosyltransferase
VTRELIRAKSWGTMTWDGYFFFHKPSLYSWPTGLTYKLIGIREFAAQSWAPSFGFGGWC